jgi:hypothetical protein
MRPFRRSLAVILFVAACVPQPANRPSREPGAPILTPTPTRMRTAVPTPAGPTPTPSFVRPTPTPEPTFLIYTVVPGDDLTAIADRFGTTRESIAYWNRATYSSLDPESPAYDQDLLKSGWTLRIIPNSVVDPENLPTLPPTPAPSPSAPPSAPAPA